jgi:hypothetical protein
VDSSLFSIWNVYWQAVTHDTLSDPAKRSSKEVLGWDYFNCGILDLDKNSTKGCVSILKMRTLRPSPLCFVLLLKKICGKEKQLVFRVCIMTRII